VTSYWAKPFAVRSKPKPLRNGGMVMTTVVAWAWANPIYALVGIVGLAVGIFYGFDGWRGNTAEVDIQESPRLKNLIYVLGAGFAAFFGDLDALDPQIKKPLVLLAYSLPCLAAAATVVVFWGTIVGVERLWAGHKGQTYGYGFARAVGDYFFYGYRHYQERLDQSRRAAEGAAVSATQVQLARFQELYLDQLTLAIAAAGSATPATRERTAQEILASIAAVIRSYHRDEDRSKGIRANLMLRRDCNKALRERLIFAGSDRANVKRCLELIVYDSHEDDPGIVLPLPDAGVDARSRALPGAPMAFVHPNRYAVIDDKSQIEFAAQVPDEIRVEIRQFLETSLYKSFGCIQIVGRSGALGVVNVEASVSHVFGNSDQEKRRTITNLMPFCAALAIVFADP
jgi:hypothetical protein